MSDPIADLLIQIKNAYMAKKATIEVEHSKVKESLAQVLQAEGYIKKVKINKKGIKMSIVIDLAYEAKKPKLSQIIRVSKPSRRIYATYKKIPKVLGGIGLVVLSTSKGLMTGKKAKKAKIGGEVVCKVW